MTRPCPFCHQEVDHMIRHVAQCDEANPDVRRSAAETVARRDAYAKAPSPCCKLRKKILLMPSTFTEQDCGIPDSEVADVMTFKQVDGLNAVSFNFCPWCGKPWVSIDLLVD